MSQQIDNAALLDFILSNIVRINNSKEFDQRQMLMLIAAISILNLGENSKFKAAARRLIQLSSSKKS